MTDKEQIIINGVDVSGCSGYYPKLGKYNCIALACNSAAICEQSPNCCYKQLQRRIAECEELRKQLNAMFESYELNCLSENSFCKKYPMVKTELNILRKRHKQALEPFEDEYFKGLDTKQIAELAKKSIRLTTENRKLENKLSDIAGICSQILDGEDYVRRIAKTILDIID